MAVCIVTLIWTSCALLFRPGCGAARVCRTSAPLLGLKAQLGSMGNDAEDVKMPELSEELMLGEPDAHLPWSVYESDCKKSSEGVFRLFCSLGPPGAEEKGRRSWQQPYCLRYRPPPSPPRSGSSVPPHPRELLAQPCQILSAIVSPIRGKTRRCHTPSPVLTHWWQCRCSRSPRAGCCASHRQGRAVQSLCADIRRVREGHEVEN